MIQHKYINKIKSVILIVTLGLFGLSLILTSCNDDDDEGSTQTELLSYGPMPIQRGAELRFIGKKLNAITSIIMPNDVEISSSAFTEQTSTSIKLIVPQDAEEGYLELIYSGGSITTLTPIGFEEPITMDAFTETSYKAGDELTLTGDYLNRVAKFIFTDRVTVDSTDFVSQSRTELKLIVPDEAQTGKISLSNGAEDPIIIYSEDDLTIILPAITTISPNPVKAGSDIVITGTDLDLVQSIIFGGEIAVTEFSVQNETSITVSVPSNAEDGKISLIQASLVEVTSTDDLVMVNPTLSFSPTTIKNGQSITVTGTDLDLINKVVFTGTGLDDLKTIGITIYSEGVIEDGGSETSITVMVPNEAQSGEVLFYTTNNKSVSGGDIEIVDPVITAFSPISSKPGTDITITGTDLDLVSSIVFTGDIEGTITNQSETEIIVTIPVGASTGVFTLVTLNGTEITSSSEVEVLQNLPNFDSYSEERAEPGKILTLNGTNMDLIKELIFPGEIYATAYGTKSDTQVEVYVPDDVTLGTGTITLITYEGEKGILPEIYFGSVDPVVDENYVFFDFNNTGAKDSWWGNAINSGILDDPDNSADGTSFWNIAGWSGTGWWDGLFFRNGNFNYNSDGIDASTDVFKFDVNVRQTIYEGRLQLHLGSYNYYWTPWNDSSEGYSTTGWISVEIPLTEFKDGDGNSISNVADGGSEFGMIWSWGTSVYIDMGIDNVRFEKK